MIISRINKMAFSKTKINDISVKPVIDGSSLVDKKRVLGYDLFPQLYTSCFIVARKASGKSTVIYNILKKCCNKLTRVVFFVTTIEKDKTYRKICKMLDKREIDYVKNDSFIDENGENLLQTMIDELKQGDEESDDDDSDHDVKASNQLSFLKVDFDKKKKKKKEPKILSPELVIVIDDQGSLCRSRQLTNLLKIHRHFKSKIIISSQGLTDLEPCAIKQIDSVLLFKGLVPGKIKDVYEHCDIGNTTLEKFTELYHYATEQKFNFLYVDTRSETYRQNFNMKIDIHDENINNQTE